LVFTARQHMQSDVLAIQNPSVCLSVRQKLRVTSWECGSEIRNQKWFNKEATYVHQHNNSYTEWNRITLYFKKTYTYQSKYDKSTS